MSNVDTIFYTLAYLYLAGIIGGIRLKITRDAPKQEIWDFFLKHFGICVGATIGWSLILIIR